RTKYPVLYLLHGWGENEQGWHTQGHVDFIMDNLLAEKKAKPMIIVMDNLNAVKPGEDASLFAARGSIAHLTVDAAPAGGGGRGGFDPKTANNGVFADAAAFNKKMKVLFLGIGSVEGPGTKNFSEELTKAGIKNAYFESPGTAHEWLTWRRCFYDFAPRLFR